MTSRTTEAALRRHVPKAHQSLQVCSARYLRGGGIQIAENDFS